MARMTFKAGEEYALKLEAVGARSEEMAIKAIETGAGIVTNEIRKNLTANLNDPESASRNGRLLFKNFITKQAVHYLSLSASRRLSGTRTESSPATPAA